MNHDGGCAVNFAYISWKFDPLRRVVADSPGKNDKSFPVSVLVSSEMEQIKMSRAI